MMNSQIHAEKILLLEALYGKIIRQFIALEIRTNWSGPSRLARIQAIHSRPI